MSIFNVKSLGAKGDGTTDDKTSIQQAVNALEAQGGGEVYFPLGNYLLSGPVLWEQPNCNYRFYFDPGAKLKGQFPDALLKRSPLSPIGGVHDIVNGHFEQNHVGGKGVMAHSCVTVKLTNCQISGNGTSLVGVETYNSQCATLDTCTIIGWAGVGVMAGNATMVLDCDITGCGEGVRHQNLGLTVLGGRFEVNGKAIVLGVKEDGSVWQSTGVKITGLSMESNGWGLHAAGGVGGLTMDACGVSCNQPGKQGGIWLETASDVLIAGLGVSTGQPFADFGIKVGNVKQAVFAGVEVEYAGAAAGMTNHWSVAQPLTNNFLSCRNLSQITQKTATFTMDSYAFPTVWCNSASPMTANFRWDNIVGGFAGMGGVPPTGTIYRFVRRGTGAVTIAPDISTGPVTLHFPGGGTPKTKLAEQYSNAFAEKIGPDEWSIYGDLIA